MAEAAGIEPLFPINTDPMMANDFGFYSIQTFELPRRFEFPGVPPVLEISWRRRRHAEHALSTQDSKDLPGGHQHPRTRDLRFDYKYFFDNSLVRFSYVQALRLSRQLTFSLFE